MSSVKKGNAFESRVSRAIKIELDAARLGISADHSQLYEKKGYYSRDRDDDIIVDISIEIWLPGADRWSMLWAFECKDYASAIPVDDVEEFKAKLDQIAGVNKKGIMVVSGALQKGALTYARSNGIAVIRLLPDDQIRHIFYQMTPGRWMKSMPKPRITESS